MFLLFCCPLKINALKFVTFFIGCVRIVGPFYFTVCRTNCIGNEQFLLIANMLHLENYIQCVNLYPKSQYCHCSQDVLNPLSLLIVKPILAYFLFFCKKHFIFRNAQSTPSAKNVTKTILNRVCYCSTCVDLIFCQVCLF